MIRTPEEGVRTQAEQDCFQCRRRSVSGDTAPSDQPSRKILSLGLRTGEGKVTIPDDSYSQSSGRDLYWLISYHWDKIHSTWNLKKVRFILAHGFVVAWHN